MRQNNVRERLNRVWPGLLLAPVLAALLLLLPSPVGRGASAVSPAKAAPAVQVVGRPWTAVGSTGVVDEASTNLYAFGTTDLTFKPGAFGSTVVARYNVTNTYDNSGDPNKPLWKKLEMGSSAPFGTSAEARLYRLKKCSVEQTLICTATNQNGNAACAECNISEAIDFTNHLYYVEVTLKKGVGPSQPRLYTLRIF